MRGGGGGEEEGYVRERQDGRSGRKAGMAKSDMELGMVSFPVGFSLKIWYLELIIQEE